MVKIKQAPLGARIGTGIGMGMAEQIPKEIEHYRKSKGLQEISNLPPTGDPFQDFARLSSVYGLTPQMLQTGGELLRQRGKLQGLRNFENGQTSSDIRSSPIQSPEPVIEINTREQKPPPEKSVTTQKPIQAVLNPPKPRTLKEKNQRAAQLHQENPGLYPTTQEAIAAVEEEEARDKAINQSLQQQRAGEQDVQKRIEDELNNRITSQGAKDIVPYDVIKDIRNKAYENVAEGRLTETEAADKYGEEVRNIAKQYKAVDTIGSFGMLARSPSENKRNINTLREDFKERNDLENFADTLIAKNNLTPSAAYYMAYKVSDQKDLNNYLSKLPELKQKTSKLGFPGLIPQPAKETLKIAPKLAQLMGKEGSPLAISMELQSKGYDPDVWMKYLSDNQKKLDLSGRQGRELEKPRNFFSTLSDFWLFSLGGLEKLMEQ